jgi:hypothetical protein
LWEPESPFLYQGPIELWQDGQRRDQLILSHGLRSFHLDERGLLVNGRPLTLHGRWVTTCSEEDVRTLRQAGCNLLIAPVEESTLPLWEQADRLGFLMLGYVSNDDALSWGRLELLSRHASCLGWLLREAKELPFHALPRKGFAGLICDSMPSKPALSVAHFLVGPAELANLGKPLLVKGEVSIEPSETAVILGRVG